MDWKLRPPVLVGEKVIWSGNGNSEPQTGVVRWIGNIPDLYSGSCVGIELDKVSVNEVSDGVWKGRNLFECRPNHGVFVPIKDIRKFNSKTSRKSKSFEETVTNENSNLDGSINEKRVYQLKPAEDALSGVNFWGENLKKTQDGKSSLWRKRIKNINSKETRYKRNSTANKNFESYILHSLIKANVNENFEKAQTLDSKAYLNQLTKSMNEIAGYFKEIKEGDERFENPQQSDGLAPYNSPDLNQTKQKKRFSFLKWFNKKNKDEPNLKMFRDSSATSSPMFPRRENTSCESIDTLFSTQTVRSFAYIPPTQYVPSAPPLDCDKSFDNASDAGPPAKLPPEKIECLYDRKKKRKAPEPPRFSRENSLPTTLEHKKNEEELDGSTSFHRRTVSESFKDKKAGAYCHVQGKRKAPQPPGSPIYPNLETINSQNSTLNRKKRPAPPPPDFNTNQTPTPSSHQMYDEKKNVNQFAKQSNSSEIAGKEEKETKNNQAPKERLTKDVSLSPLPSRPWYKRSNRDSSGSNIIRKDLLKGFDKKKNKEGDDWMPEVGFSRRSLSTESSHSHNKFNIFSKLDKNDDKKKEEKRKSQISILTNISELDREAAEIVRKEQFEEKKMIEANDEKYYTARNDDRVPGYVENFHFEEKKAQKKNSVGSPLIGQRFNEQNKRRSDQINTTWVKTSEDENPKKEQPIIKEEVTEITPKTNQLNEFPTKAPTDMTNGKTTEAKSSPSRLNYFNVDNKELNYLNKAWICQKCTLENPGWRVFCEICSSVKPRFLYNAANKAQNQLDEDSETYIKEDPKVAEPVKPTKLEQTPKADMVEGIKNQEEIAGTSTETLDELRKKRMNFFAPKAEPVTELHLVESEPSANDLSKTTSKETKETSPRNEIEAKNGHHLGKTLTEGSAEMKGSQEPERTQPLNDKEQTSLIPGKKTTECSGKEIVTNKQASKPEEVAEAYIVTKTIVLEDIIVKKAPKVSTSVQTKSSLPASSEPGVVRPPRTKKLTFENRVNLNKKAPKAEVKPYQEEELEELMSKLTHAEGLANFRADIETMPLNTEMNTVAVNRLLRKLETAINCGDQNVAAVLAKELALMKINCSVTRQVHSTPSTSNIKPPFIPETIPIAAACFQERDDADEQKGKEEEKTYYKTHPFLGHQTGTWHALLKIDFSVDLYIEDKVSHQGPIPTDVSPTMTLLQLKQKIQRELGIPLEVQRWILGKKLATDDSKTLEAEGVKSDYCPIFLYLVAPDNRKIDKEPKENSETPTPNTVSDKTENTPNTKTKGWYYNYEEDHYSFCDDSEEDSECDPQPEQNAKESPQSNSDKSMTAQDDLKKTETENVQKQDTTSLLQLGIRDNENGIEKELKLISANSVKQKVEQLNKTFAENSRAKILPRPLQSLDTWKCGVCGFVNSPLKLSCTSCNAKKIFSRSVAAKKGNEEELKEASKKENIKAGNIKNDNIHYKALIELQDADLVPNAAPFSCPICMVDYALGEGVTLKDCLHTFCRACLINTVKFSEDAEVKCPYLDETYSCTSVLQQREIKALVPQGIFELHLAKSVKEAENKTENAFHCKTPDCKGWCIYEDNVNEFHCPVCKFTNCLTCQAIHTGINCRQYQERVKDASETDLDAKKSREMLEEMVEKGEAMACPKCQVVLMKKWGCDWLRCSVCKTEICWVTRGFRWGPGGKGDTSGGCKCGVNGVKCHPKCNYCH